MSVYQCCQYRKSKVQLFVQCHSSLSESTYEQKLYNVLFVNLLTVRSIFPPLLLSGRALLAVHTGTHKLWLRFAQLGLFVCNVCRAWRCGCTPTSPVGVTSNKSLLCRLMNRTTSPTVAESPTLSYYLH
jgi:hypothetical protein